MNRKDNVEKLKKWIEKYGDNYTDPHKPNSEPPRCSGCVCEPDEGRRETERACVQSRE